MTVFYALMSASAIFLSYTATEALTLYNTTSLPIHTGLYYRKEGFDYQISTVTVQPQGSTHINKPDTVYGHERLLVCSHYKHELAEVLTREQADRLAGTLLTPMSTGPFYVELNDGNLYMYSKIDRLLNPCKRFVSRCWSSLIYRVPTGWRHEFEHHAYKTRQARVRLSRDLCPAEVAYSKLREPKVKTCLEGQLGKKISTQSVPRIALCLSGGGCRAMVFSLGILKGLQEVGLLDALLYISSLSGSTWAVAPWLQTRARIDDLLAALPYKLRNGLKTEALTTDILSRACRAKLAFKQDISGVDIFGLALAHTLLDEPYIATNFDAQAAYIKEAQVPFPLYVSAVVDHTYKWLEINPYEVGNDDLGGYIPIWALGRTFKQGRSQDYAAPLPISYFMGVWGAAFSATFGEIINDTLTRVNNKLVRTVLTGIEKCGLATQRPVLTRVPNFTYGLPTTAFTREPTLALLDGGLHGKIPLQPLLKTERALDIIIVVDMEESIKDSDGLHQAEKYAREHNLLLPAIDYSSLDKHTIQVFGAPDKSQGPVIVYIPCIKNTAYSPFDPITCIEQEGYCRTNNFTYTSEQIHELSGLATYTIKQCYPEMLRTIALCIAQKSLPV